MIVIDATYIHESGGRSLLVYFLEKFNQLHVPFRLLLDERAGGLEKMASSAVGIVTIKSSERNRRRYYASLPEETQSVFCFANVPPPGLRRKVKVYILFHNALMLSGLFEKNGYSIKEKLSFLVKRLYIQRISRKGYEWIVQSETMRAGLSGRMGIDSTSIHVLPFYKSVINKEDTSVPLHSPDYFLYVADGVPQKNHHTLLEAWQILRNKFGQTPELHLTLPLRYQQWIDKIGELNSEGCRIINHGVLDKDQLSVAYQSAGYLVFPSLAESFGLPLIEGAQAGCRILAADLPYVYDVIIPTAAFNPYNPESIAETVAAMGKNTVQRDTKLIVNDQVDSLVTLIANTSSNR